MSGVTVHRGDSRDVLKTLADNSIDSCVTDPPYALVSIVKRFGKTATTDDTATSDRSRRGADGCARLAKGFMGQQWDNGSTAFDPVFWSEVLRVLKPGAHLVAFSGTRTYHRMAVAIEDAGFEIRDQIGWAYGSGFPKSHNQGNGWGTALKPAWEPIVLARKPLSEKTVAANVLKWGTGAINVDGCRVVAADMPIKWDVPRGGIWRESDGTHGQIKGSPQSAGRWPANIAHDGSDEVVGAFPDSDGQQGDVRGTEPSDVTQDIYGKFNGHVPAPIRGDTGSAARFFYTAKADAEDRIGSKHPTVKPVDLMQWLVRLVTPKGGLVLDPFAGSGTTGEAAFRGGMRCVLVEREAKFVADIERRIRLFQSGADERAREAAKAKTADSPVDHGPLFGNVT